ncbi:MAG: NAD(P)H-hydrate epimerase [Phycisphaerae bacterium]
MLTLTCEQIRRIDQLAVEQYAMPSILLMENAGLNAAHFIMAEFLDLTDRSVVIFCGPGNNGGDGFVIARHLHNSFWHVKIILAAPAEKLKGDALTNYTVVSRMGIPISDPDSADRLIERSDVLVDALLGTGFQGEPRPPIDQLIRKINASGKPVIAVDVPSGLDCFTGTPAQNTVRAHITITFAAAKNVFFLPPAIEYVGKLHLADIGIPKELLLSNL